MDGSQRTLDSVVYEALAARTEQIANNQHLEHPSRNLLSQKLRDYAYSFVEEPRFHDLFKPYRRWSPSTSSGSLDDDDDDDDDEDDDQDDESSDGESPETSEEDLEQRDWSLSAAQAKALSTGLAMEYSRSRKGKACGHVFVKGESVYRCKECSLDDSCVLCSKCFKASNHQGHEVSFSMHSGGCGCCDCGDHEAWKQEIDCAYHNPNVPYPEAPAGEGEQGPPQTTTSGDAGSDLPVELMDIIQYRIEEALDFVVHVVNVFPYTMEPPANPNEVYATKPAYRFLPMEEHADLAAFSGPWSVVLWNDEKHSYYQVIDCLMTATKCSRTKAFQSATDVDNYGLKVVASSTDSGKVWQVAQAIAQIELGVTVCTTRDAIALEAVGYMLDWLHDMSKIRIGNHDNFVGRILAEALFAKNRLKILLTSEDRLWKKARASLRYILMSMLTVGQDYKLRLGQHYAFTYPVIMSRFLLTDREPDNSVTQFSVQLFSAPSVAAHLVEHHGFFEVILQLLYSFFTQQHTMNVSGVPEKGIAFPPSPDHPPIDPDSSSFRHKRYFHVFQDLNHIISHPQVQHYIATNLDTFDVLIRFLKLFGGMNPQTRASAVHVEYETESWVTAFNLTIQLSKLAKTAGKAFQEASPGNDPVADAAYLSAIKRVAEEAIEHNLRQNPVKTHFVHWADKDWQLVHYRVSRQPVSFHHPLQLLLAEMLKPSSRWTAARIQPGVGGLHNRFSRLIADSLGMRGEEGKLPVSILMEEPLRAFSLLAQIRAGLWVRNGFALRAQHLHYREYSLREYTFDQDVFLLQVAFAISDPEYLLATMIDKMELWAVFGHEVSPASQGFDNAHLVSILEEFLYLLVVVFSETVDVESLSPAQAVRRELIHCLLLGPYTYSEVLRNTTERTVEETCFDRVLSEVATFRAPDSSVVTSDVGGVYTLKKECYNEVDPYYYRFTRNQREEAIKLLKAHFKNNEFLRPTKIHPVGAFAENDALVAALASKELSVIIAEAIQFAIKDKQNYAETVVELCLRLISIALLEYGAGVVPTFHEADVVRLLCRLEEDEGIKELHTMVSFILDDLAQIDHASVARYRKRAIEAAKAPASGAAESVSQATLLEQKRAAAKARQAAIMQQFAAAQKSFLEANETDEEEDASKEDKDASMHDDTADGNETTDTVTVEGVSRNKKKARVEAVHLGSCIVCQEDFNVSKPFGSLALIQTSSLVRYAPPNDSPYKAEVPRLPASLDQDLSAVRPYGVAGQTTSEKEGRGGTSYGFPRHTKKGLYTSACGHLMHVACFETYCASISQRHALQVTRNHPENPERKEFICPLCKSLGNVLLPLSEDDTEESMPPPAGPPTLTEEWLRSAIETASPHNPELKTAIKSFTSNGSGVQRAWAVRESLPSSAFSFGLNTVSQAERQMLERLASVVYPLDAENLLLDEQGQERDARAVSHEVLNYTISCIEIGLRGKGTGTLHSASLPDASSRLIRSLLSALDKLVVLSSGTPRGTETARTALMWFIFGDRPKHTGVLQHPHFLSRDPLTILIEAAAVAPHEFYQFAAVCFYAHVVRTAHRLYDDEEDEDESMLSADDTPLHADATALADFTLDLQQASWSRAHEDVTIDKILKAQRASKRVFAHSLPFLRRAAILHGAMFPTYNPPTSQDSEFLRLLAVLRIPHPRELFGRRHGKLSDRSVNLSILLENWYGTWLERDDTLVATTVVETVQMEHPGVYELLGLPKDLSVLLESAVTRKCKRCRSVPKDPAICLICGELVCQQSFCCMDQDIGEEPSHGECNTHMWECGTSTGIYFLVKRCVLIYLYADKGTFATAPYLDVHGEADPGLKKHRPLYLNQARYDEIRKVWLNHSVATIVTRRLEAGNDAGGWDSFCECKGVLHRSFGMMTSV